MVYPQCNCQQNGQADKGPWREDPRWSWGRRIPDSWRVFYFVPELLWKRDQEFCSTPTTATTTKRSKKHTHQFRLVGCSYDRWFSIRYKCDEMLSTVIYTCDRCMMRLLSASREEKKKRKKEKKERKEKKEYVWSFLSFDSYNLYLSVLPSLLKMFLEETSKSFSWCSKTGL